MLTFSLCFIAFFIGIVFTVWFFFGFLNSIFSKVSDGFGMMIESWSAKSNQLNTHEEPINIDVVSWLDRFNFIVNFATEKSKELEILIMKREAEIKEKKMGFEDEKMQNKNMFEFSDNPFKNFNNTEDTQSGTQSGTQMDTQQETPDNQGFPETDTLIEDSQIPKDSVWKSTL